MRGTALLSLIVALGCAPKADADRPVVEAAVGERFDLSPGEAAVVDEAFHVAFARIAEDSRCPSGVMCIQGGNAAVAFGVETETGSATLTLNTDREPKQAASMGYVLRLIELRPRPVEGTPLDSSAYRAGLVVYLAP